VSSSVRQFPFHALESVGRDDVTLVNRALDFVAGSNTAELADSIREMLGDALARSGLSIEHAGAIRHTETASTDLTAWRGFVYAPGGDQRAMLTIDSTLVDDWLRWALEDDRVRLGAPPGPDDWGAVGYVVLRVLQLLARRGTPPLMLASTPPTDEAVGRFFARHRSLHEFCWIVSDRNSVGWVRVYLPARWLDTYLDGMDHTLERSLLAGLESRPRLSNLSLRFDAVLGRREEVARREVHSLRPGDVIFVERHCIRGLDSVAVEASEGALRRGKCGFAGFLTTDGPRWKFQVTRTEVPESPVRENEMSDQSEIAPVEEAAEVDEEKTESLNISALDRASVDIDVRVGSIGLSVSELARLQSGQILELDRRVGDLVDILVDGDLHARGELVNVEGAIGVRITSVEPA